MACEIKYNTLLDLARQAKIITGNTACFDGKIEAGLPFSGYPSGVDTSTIVSLGVVGSSESAVLSGNNLTTLFDVIFGAYSATTWSNPLFSANTSGLTLPITPISATTQIVGPIWTATQTGMTGDYVIDTQYTGYTITYSPFNVVGDLSGATGTTYSAVTGFTSAIQENFSAGTLDYKGPLDYISSIEDATVDGRLTTKKLTITNGASSATIGYVLTQLDSYGRAGWVFNSASASTNTFVTGGTLNGTNLDLTWNTGGSVPSIDFSSLSGGTFTGNTSGDCITDLYLTNLYGCSPITVHDTITYNGSIIDSATTNSFIFGDSHVLTASTGTHGTSFDSNVILGGDSNRITPLQVGRYNAIIGGNTNEIGGVSRVENNIILGSTNSSIINSYTSIGGSSMLGGDNNNILGGGNSAIIGGQNNTILPGIQRAIILGGQNITGTTDDTVYVPILNINNIVSGGTSVNNLGIDASGNVVTGTAGGGGATIDPYQDEGNVTSITWDVSGTSTNYEATLTGVTTLTMSNVRNGDYGTLIVTQDGTGSRTLSFVGANHKVVNGGGGAPTLTTTAGATDILSFTYNGTNFYWTVGNDYT